MRLYLDHLLTKLIASVALQTDSRLQCMGVNEVTKELRVFAEKSSQSKDLAQQLYAHSFYQYSLSILTKNGMDIQNSPVPGIRESPINPKAKIGRDISKVKKTLEENHHFASSAFNSSSGDGDNFTFAPKFRGLRMTFG